MAFEPKEWRYDDDVTEQELNRIEQGIVEAHQKADQNTSDLASHLADFAQVWNNRIVEMGENANGVYVRWENGLQICFANKDIVRWSPQTTPNAGINDAYYGTDLFWIFPASFIDTPSVQCNISHGGTGGLWGFSIVYTVGIVPGSCLLSLWTEHSRDLEATGTAAAIGRWK